MTVIKWKLRFLVNILAKKVRGLTCPWMNGSIKREIRQREFLLNKARRSNLDEDWSAYRRSRNRVTKLVRDSKSKYSRELIDENSDDPKKFWKTVKQIMPGQKTKRVTSIDVNGTQIYDDKEIANSFNNFFTKTVETRSSFWMKSTICMILQISDVRSIVHFPF